MNATLLPDDPTVTWKPQIIAKHILKQVHSLDIDTIITFDRDGVSHHANHCALFYSSISIYVANLLQEGIKIPSDSPPKSRTNSIFVYPQDVVYLPWTR